MKLKVGTLVKFEPHTYTTKDDDASNGYGILTQNLSTSIKKPNNYWMIYIQNLGYEDVFRLGQFRRVLGITEEK